MTTPITAERKAILEQESDLARLVERLTKRITTCRPDDYDAIRAELMARKAELAALRRQHRLTVNIFTSLPPAVLAQFRAEAKRQAELDRQYPRTRDTSIRSVTVLVVNKEDKATFEALNFWPGGGTWTNVVPMANANLAELPLYYYLVDFTSTTEDDGVPF